MRYNKDALYCKANGVHVKHFGQNRISETQKCGSYEH
jgi:hypothetical protein